MNAQVLFNRSDLREFLEKRIQAARSEISQMDHDFLLNVDSQSLEEQIVNRYMYRVPQLSIEKIAQEHTSIDLFSSVFVYHIPYDGENELFHYRPSSYWLLYPKAVITDEELLIPVEISLSHVNPDVDAQANRNAKHADGQVEKELDLIQKFLGSIEHDIKIFHGTLRGQVQLWIRENKTKIKTDQKSSKATKYPVYVRADAQTYYPPINRKPLFTPEGLKKQSIESNAALEISIYEDILSTISHMAHVIERNPRAFSAMQEEDLRHFFLLMLNAQFLGRATGETFNLEGKTDILIREGDKNIFIAECKFWHGPKKFTETIDQLMGYKTWRDTKTAIILFNQNVGFTSVLKQIPKLAGDHPNHKTFVKSSDDLTQTQYIFTHRDDPEKEFWLTVIAFDVPVT